MNKSDISKALNELERKCGFIVLNFNSRNVIYSGNQGWVDYVIFSYSHLWLIELKLGKDKLSIMQAEVKKRLESIDYKSDYTHYRVMTENNYETIIDEIIKLR